MSSRFILLASAVVATCFSWQSAFATNILLNIEDSAGEGFYDPAVVPPVGGNTGLTVGDQRRKVFEYAAELLATILNSSVDLTVDVAFDPLSCSLNSAVLGSGGPNAVICRSGPGCANVSSLPHANTYYTAAQANALQGSDVAFGSELSFTVNSNLDDNPSCLGNADWYYGLDGNVPSGDIDLLSTVLHELIHGLGFYTPTNLSNGARFSNKNDVYILDLEDHSAASTWPNLTNAGREASAIDDGDLLWIGENVDAHTATYTNGVSHGHIEMHAPATLSLGSSVNHFANDLSPNELMEPSISTSQSFSSIGLAKQLLEDIGWPIFANNKPIVAAVNNITVLLGQSEQFELVVMDNDTSESSLTVSAQSSNESILSSGDISVSSTGRNRSVTLSPQMSSLGSTNVVITVSDGVSSTDTTFSATVIDNQPPEVTIDSPIDGARIYTTPQQLMATASDLEDGDLTSAVSWSSMPLGVSGTGGSISSSLADNSYQLTASVTDSAGHTTEQTIDIAVSLYGDDDNDGLTNNFEATSLSILGFQLDPNLADTDNDQISDYHELNGDGDPLTYNDELDTNPINSDSDGDGIKDGADFAPLDPTLGAQSVPLPIQMMLILAGLLLLIATYVGKVTIREIR